MIYPHEVRLREQRRAAAYLQRLEQAWTTTKRLWGVPLAMLLLRPVLLLLEGLAAFGRCLEDYERRFENWTQERREKSP